MNKLETLVDIVELAIKMSDGLTKEQTDLLLVKISDLKDLDR